MSTDPRPTDDPDEQEHRRQREEARRYAHEVASGVEAPQPDDEVPEEFGPQSP